MRSQIASRRGRRSLGGSITCRGSPDLSKVPAGAIGLANDLDHVGVIVLEIDSEAFGITRLREEWRVYVVNKGRD